MMYDPGYLPSTEPIYEMLQIAEADKLCLHLIYDMWDAMIEKVNTTIYRIERKDEREESSFYTEYTTYCL